MSPSPLTETDLPAPTAFTAFHPFIKGVFSQWHPTALVMDGRTYATAEQWMMAEKARLFGDAAALDAILGTPDPAEQKRLGQGESPRLDPGQRSSGRRSRQQ